MVQDTASGDWTFPGGGCKRTETIKECAERELMEETCGLVCPELSDLMRKGLRSCHDMLLEITSGYRPPGQRLQDVARGELVTTRHAIYAFRLPLKALQLVTSGPAGKIKVNQGAERCMQETQAVAFVSAEALLSGKAPFRLWRFLELEHVVEHVVAAISHYRSFRLVDGTPN